MAAVLDQLEARDESESSMLPYYDTFTKMADQLRLLLVSEQNGPLLLTENARLRDERSKLIARLNAASYTQDEADRKAVSAWAEIASLRQENTILKKQVNDAQAAMSEKNRIIDTINDQILLDQMQINLLMSKHEQVLAENDALVNRWIAKVASDADVLNDANEILVKRK